MMLRAAAQIFSWELRRAAGSVARWGGEELALLLADTSWDGALDVAERMRKCVENAVIPLANGQATKVTVSIGVNVRIPALGDSLDDFVQHADKALYAAKQEGRNRVCRYDGARCLQS